eukprot:COSAG02_NODE_18273_length_949_cov_1.256471_1_plen_171_part_10
MEEENEFGRAKPKVLWQPDGSTSPSSRCSVRRGAAGSPTSMRGATQEEIVPCAPSARYIENPKLKHNSTCHRFWWYFASRTRVRAMHPVPFLDICVDIAGATKAPLEFVHTCHESKRPALQHQLVGTNLHIVDRVAGGRCLVSTSSTKAPESEHPSRSSWERCSLSCHLMA